MFIKNYDFSSFTAKVCYNENEAEKMLKNGFRVLQIAGTRCCVYTNIIRHFELIKSGSEQFNSGDTVIIHENGNVQKLFDRASYSHTIVTTNRCSSNCIMCPYTSNQRRNSQHQNIEMLIDEVNYLPDNTEHIIITGGEPTLIGIDFFRLMSKIKERFPNISCLLLTNGRVFASSKAVELAAETFPVSTQVAIPIHSADENLHDAITQSKGSFRQTLSAIRRLLSEEFFIEIRIVVSGLNIESMDCIAEMITEKFPQVSLVNFMGVEICGNAALNSDSVWINYSTAFKKCEAAVGKLIRAGIDVGLYNFPLCSVSIRFHGIYKKSISDYKVRFDTLCESCTKKELCGGFFASSLKYAQGNVSPYFNTGVFR